MSLRTTISRFFSFVTAEGFKFRDTVRVYHPFYGNRVGRVQQRRFKFWYLVSAEDMGSKWYFVTNIKLSATASMRPPMPSDYAELSAQVPGAAAAGRSHGVVSGVGLQLQQRVYPLP